MMRSAALEGESNKPSEVVAISMPAAVAKRASRPFMVGALLLKWLVHFSFRASTTDSEDVFRLPVQSRRKTRGSQRIEVQSATSGEGLADQAIVGFVHRGDDL